MRLAISISAKTTAQLSFILFSFALLGCGKQARVEWWDSYKSAIVVQTPADNIGVGAKLSQELQAKGIEIIDRKAQPGDLSHEVGLVTLVASYSFTDGIRANLSINLRDYTTGLILRESERAMKNDEPGYTYSESKFGGTLDEKMTELVGNFGKWFSRHHTQFVSDAVLFRPRWWTNEKRTTQEPK